MIIIFKECPIRILVNSHLFDIFVKGTCLENMVYVIFYHNLNVLLHGNQDGPQEHKWLIFIATRSLITKYKSFNLDWAELLKAL